MTNLLDILKETELRVGLTEAFRATGAREVLSPEVLQRRLLLCLYEIISNLTPGGRSSIEMVIHRQTAIDAKCGDGRRCYSVSCHNGFKTAIPKKAEILQQYLMNSCGSRQVFQRGPLAHKVRTASLIAQYGRTEANNSLLAYYCITNPPMP